MKKRCEWANGGNDLMLKYHDEEWGVPVYDDKKIFEFLVLESAQAGLSWQTILNKREGYRKLFHGFDFKKVSKMEEKDIKKLLNDASIIRNRAKIEAAINNSRRFIEVAKEFKTFSNYIWSFVGGSPIQNKTKKISDYKAVTEESVKLAKDLKNRGFKFLGPTTIYAHMQASGMVNDHMIDCFRHKEVQKMGL